MPRSKSDRAFGFKAKGLIRILTAADVEEVKTALDALSFQPIGSALAETIKRLLKAPLELLEGLIDLIFETFIPLSENLRGQVRILDSAIAGAESIRARITGPAPRRLPPLDVVDRLLSDLRGMRRDLAAEIIRQDGARDEIDKLRDEAEELGKAQETSLQEILDTDQVA